MQSELSFLGKGVFPFRGTAGGGGGGSSQMFALTAFHVCAGYWYSYQSMQNAHTTLLTLHDGSRGTRWTA